MKTTAFTLLAVMSLAFSNAAFSAGGKTYQVTGTVVEVTATKIVVQKGTERLELDVGPETKLHGEVKAGDKVTITYAMTASKVDAGGGLIKFGTPAPAATP
jgi:type 1 fimbria pilin